MGPPVVRSVDRSLGLVGGTAGLAASSFLLSGPVVRVATERSSGATTRHTVSGIDYLLGSPDAQFALFASPVLMGAVALLGAFVVAGMLSIGLVDAPAAALLLLGALLGREE